MAPNSSRPAQDMFLTFPVEFGLFNLAESFFDLPRCTSFCVAFKRFGGDLLDAFLESVLIKSFKVLFNGLGILIFWELFWRVVRLNFFSVV